MSTTHSKAIPLVGTQKSQLLALIREKEAILTCKASNPRLPGLRAKAWEEITSKFNASNPGLEPRTPMQLKRSWSHIKRKIKTDDLAIRKKICATGGGPPPPPPKLSEEDEMARALMAHDLAMPSRAIEVGTLHPLDEDGNSILNIVIDYEDESSCSHAVADSRLPPNPSDSSDTTTFNLQSVLSSSSIPSDISLSSIPSSSSSTPRPRPVPKSSKKTEKQDVEVVLDKLSQRGEELHLAQLKVEEARLKSEEARLKSEEARQVSARAKTEAFLAMSAYFKNLNGSLNEGTATAADIARTTSELLLEGLSGL